jgi:hypothetical protein
MVTGANITSGRAMARNGALTLDANHIAPPVGTCTVGTGGGGAGGSSGPVPIPGTGVGGIGFLVTALMVTVGAVLIVAGRRARAHASR